MIANYSFVFKRFKEYATFILNNDLILAEMAKEYLVLAKKNQIPLLKLLTHLSDEEIIKLNLNSITNFLKQAISDDALNEAIASLDRWEKNQLPGVSKEDIQTLDLILVYSIRKQLYILFLSKFTQDIKLFSEIILELESFHNKVEQHAVETFVRIKQEDLQKQKEFSESIINNIQDGIIAFDKDQKIIAWNNVLEERNNLKRDQVLGKNIFDLFPELKNQEEGIAALRAFDGEKVIITEKKYTNRKGWYEGNVIPLHNDKGEVFGAVSIIHDITEWKDNQEKLKEQQEKILRNNEELSLAYEKVKEQEEFIKQVAISVPHIIYVWDIIEQKQIYTNIELSKFLGYNEEDLKGMGGNLFSIIHPEDQSIVMDRNRKFLENKENEISENIVRLKSKNNGWRYLRLKTKIHKYKEGGHPWQILGVSEDITNEVNAEIELKNKNDELSSALEELKSAEEQLLLTNAKLERRVEERTRELAASEEELKQMLERTIELNEQLLARENFLSSIIEQTPVSTWIADAHGTQIQVNQACLDLFGVEDPTAGIGKYNILKDESIIDQPFHTDILNVFKEGKIAKFGTPYNLKQVTHLGLSVDKPVHINTTIFPVKDPQGKVTNAVIQHEDITDRVRAEEAIKKSEEQLLLLTDSLPVLISYLDVDHYYRFVNKSYTEWFQMPKEAIVGKHITALIGEEAYEYIRPKMNQAIAGEEVRYETRVNFKSGARDVEANYIPHREDGKIMGFYALIYDISEAKKARYSLENALENLNKSRENLRELNEELVSKNQQLLRINEDLDNFIYTASHDLKSPVVNIEGLILALERSLKSRLDNKEKLLLEMMETSALKLKNTIGYLTDVTRATKTLDEIAETISFKEVIDSVKTDIGVYIEEVNPIIIEDLEIEQVEFVRANLNSIIQNLLTNAIKFKSPKKQLRIEISTKREENFIVFSVMDNGLGMDPNQQSKLFTLFRRMHTHIEGTGVGLYIVKRVVENAGGKVIVSSKVNEGSTFKVYFPIRH